MFQLFCNSFHYFNFILFFVKIIRLEMCSVKKYWNLPQLLSSFHKLLNTAIKERVGSSLAILNMHSRLFRKNCNEQHYKFNFIMFKITTNCAYLSRSHLICHNWIWRHKQTWKTVRESQRKREIILTYLLYGTTALGRTWPPSSEGFFI